MLHYSSLAVPLVPEQYCDICNPSYKWIPHQLFLTRVIQVKEKSLWSYFSLAGCCTRVVIVVLMILCTEHAGFGFFFAAGRFFERPIFNSWILQILFQHLKRHDFPKDKSSVDFFAIKAEAGNRSGIIQEFGALPTTPFLGEEWQSTSATNWLLHTTPP